MVESEHTKTGRMTKERNSGHLSTYRAKSGLGMQVGTREWWHNVNSGLLHATTYWLWILVMCGLRPGRKPVTGPEKPECFCGCNTFWTQNLSKLANKKKIQNSICGNFFFSNLFFGIFVISTEFGYPLSAGIYFIFAGHMCYRSVTQLGLSRAFEGHRPKPAHH